MNKKKILILLAIFVIGVGFAISSVSSVEATKTEKIKVTKGNTMYFPAPSQHTAITHGKKFVITSYMKYDRNSYSSKKSYTGYVNVKAKNKNIKIHSITLKQGTDRKGFKYKTYKINSNKKTIKIGKNISPLAGYGSVYKIKYSLIKNTVKSSYKSTTKPTKGGSVTGEPTPP